MKSKSELSLIEIMSMLIWQLNKDNLIPNDLSCIYKKEIKQMLRIYSNLVDSEVRKTHV